MSNNYEQEVCNILKHPAIHQKLEELKEITKKTGRTTGIEYGFNVCSDGRITEIIEGGLLEINPDIIHKECNYQIDINFHTHPNYISYPSTFDFIFDMDNQIRIASCIYGEKDDKITCFRTSDEYRNKFKPIFDEADQEYLKLDEAYEKATDLKEKSKLFKQRWIAREKYENIINKMRLNIINNIYPDIDNINKMDMYEDYINRDPKFGNFGDVWVKDCGKI
jgi:hypothetical protein